MNYYNSERILAIKDGTMAKLEHFGDLYHSYSPR